MPPWLQAMLAAAGCPKCKQMIPLSAVRFVGISTLFAHANTIPQSQIGFVCPNCGQRLTFGQNLSSDEIVEGVAFLYQVLEAQMRLERLVGSKDSPEAPPPSFWSDRPKIRPSSTAAKSMTPITEEESKQFLMKLSRVSFRPGSKSFAAFLMAMKKAADQPPRPKPPKDSAKPKGPKPKGPKKEDRPDEDRPPQLPPSILPPDDMPF